MIKQCVICEKRFEARDGRAKYCSKDCKKEGVKISLKKHEDKKRMLREQKRLEKEINQPKISLAEACRQMKELGIQYAEWYRLYGGNK